MNATHMMTQEEAEKIARAYVAKQGESWQKTLKRESRRKYWLFGTPQHFSFWVDVGDPGKMSVTVTAADGYVCGWLIRTFRA